MDDRIRRAVYHAIYGTPALERYALEAVPPVHIIVKNALEGGGYRGRQDIAGIKANGVSGGFALANDLRVDT